MIRLLLNFRNNILPEFIRFSCSKTIFALSSGQGKCGVAVIRVSGKNTEAALKNLTEMRQLPKPRTALLRSIRHPITKEILDKGLIIWFPAPNSFTGENCLELHIHGGPAVISAILNALSLIPKLRLAEPGEFTRQAFYNGKLDLTEIEGLADLLQAETEAQRKQAFYQSQGSLSKIYNNWGQILMKCVANIEAHIDFEETEMIDGGILIGINKKIQVLTKEIEQHLSDGRKGEILRSGVKTVILGEPNAGKSSLLNLLCKKPAAIVTPIEGTTRDILEINYNIGGYPLILIDTAGLRSQTDDLVEKEGIKRALKTYEIADLVILVIDLQKYLNWLQLKNNSNCTFVDYLKLHVKSLNLYNLINESSRNIVNLFNKKCIVVLNKIDLMQNLEKTNLEVDTINCVSCINNVGISNLVDNITSYIKILCGEPSNEQPSMNQLRHRQHLNNCLYYLNLFLQHTSTDSVKQHDTVLIAEYLRKALRHLGKLVGAITTEQILDVIFKEFCIGK